LGALNIYKAMNTNINLLKTVSIITDKINFKFKSRNITKISSRN